MWHNLKSLTIHEENNPLMKQFNSWTWETITSRCSNLQEITFIFGTVYRYKTDREVEPDIERAMQGLPNNSFPKISNLTSLTSVTFEGISDMITAYFAQTLLRACNNLSHLYFCPIGRPSCGDENVFGL
jgi:hypothetical protein